MWVTSFMFFCFGYSALSLTVHLVPHIININISPATAASVLAAIGAVNVFGRLFFGLIGDRLGSFQAYRMGLAIILLGLICLLFIRQSWMFYGFAILWGMSAGGMGTIQTPIIAELFGVKSLGAIFGVCGMGVMIGGSIGPVITGFLFDLTGNYQIAFIVCAFFALAGVAINFWLTAFKKKLEQQAA
jgi:MFS family permease